MKEAEDPGDKKPLPWSQPWGLKRSFFALRSGAGQSTALSLCWFFGKCGKDYYLFCKAAVRFRSGRPAGSPEWMGAAHMITIYITPGDSKNGEYSDQIKKLTSFWTSNSAVICQYPSSLGRNITTSKAEAVATVASSWLRASACILASCSKRWTGYFPVLRSQILRNPM